jgi:hypothetical protein
MSAAVSSCPKCGQAVPADAPAGLCPRCLVAGGFTGTQLPAKAADESDSKGTLHIVIPEDAALPGGAPRHFGKYQLLEEIGDSASLRRRSPKPCGASNGLLVERVAPRAEARTDWAAGCATLASPSPHPSPLGRGRNFGRLWAMPVCAKYRLGEGCSLSLPPSRRSGAMARREGGGERVRVRGNGAVAHANGRISQSLLRNMASERRARSDGPYFAAHRCNPRSAICFAGARRPAPT